MATEEQVNLEDLSPEELREVAEKKQQEYDQLKSSTAKGINLMTDAIKFYKENGSTPEKLEQLQKDNPDVFKIVQEKFYDGKTIDDILGRTKQDSQVDIDAKVKEAVEQTKVQEKYDFLLSQVPEDQRETVAEEYKFIAGDRKLKPDEVDAIFTKALRIHKVEVDPRIEASARASAVSAGANKQ